MRPFPANALLLLVLLFLSAVPSHAQMPQGPPVPLCTVQSDEMRSAFRFGYDGNGRVFKYPGEFGADTNFVTNARSAFYGLGDVFIESYLAPENIFQPSRLWGTFELGERVETVPNRYIEYFLRHQSAHNVDSTLRPDPMWENVGARYRICQPRCDAWFSAAYYTRRIGLDYSTDVQAHGTYRVGKLLGRNVEIDCDLHHVSEVNGPRSGFFDFSLEPSLQIRDHDWIYVDAGQVHDIDKPNGSTATPLIVGARASM